MRQAAAVCFLAAALCAGAVPGAQRFEVQVLEPAERAGAVRQFPVAVGLVFPKGELLSARGGCIVDDAGGPVPQTAEVTGWWGPDKKEIKWLLVRFRADTDKRYFFDPSRSAPELQMPRMLSEREGRVIADTGALRAFISTKGPPLFLEAEVNGRTVLSAGEDALVLTADDGKKEVPARLTDWSAAIEDNNWPVSTVKAGGVYRGPNGKPIARLDLRYEFAQGESFVRLYHTLTWMVQDPAFGAREWALRFKPNFGANGAVRIGESDYTDANTPVPWAANTSVTAFQDSAEHFAITSGGKPLKEGRRLGGWIALEDEQGRGVGISLREAWQTFPTALGVADGALRVAFWPREAGRMAFRPEDIMPPDFFNDAKYWNRFKWVENKGHFLHEHWDHPQFLHTAEGAARTHELAIHFYDRDSTRAIGQINSVTQHPIVLRQDPAVAMRVPFMGFDIEPVRADYPDLERSIESIGRMAVGRWPQTHDYGLWRYGMVRWGQTGVSYRWMDGHQYDLLLIPWLLFLRGGDRRWYEEAEATARFAMDVATNHFNTRGLPTGYQAAAAGMPFPWRATFMTKAPKIHYLAYYHHLAGYRRARDVLGTVVAGNQQAAGQAFSQPDNPHRGGHGRELYNMNTFWVNAWEETFDPEIKELAREWLQLTMTREYRPDLNAFQEPTIYVYPGLILQHRLWNDDALKALMLRHLGGEGYPGLEDGGVYAAEDAPGCGWAWRMTGDRRYVKVAWDVSRTLADLAPDHDWASSKVPQYPISGNQFYRHFLLPILTGYSDAARLGMKQSDPFDMRDTFISLPAAGQGRVRAEVRLRPRQDGALRVRFLFTGRRQAETGGMTVKATSPGGQAVIETVVPAKAREAVDGRFFPSGADLPQRGELTIPDARKGQVYRLTIEGDAKGDPQVLVLADADMVQRVNADATVFFYNLAGQYYVGTRIFTRAEEDEITMTNPYGLPFSIRDADTGELLHRFTLADPSRSLFRVGRGRILQISMTGRMDGRAFKGVSPWFARTREAWFDGEQ